MQKENKEGGGGGFATQDEDVEAAITMFNIIKDNHDEDGVSGDGVKALIECFEEVPYDDRGVVFVNLVGLLKDAGIDVDLVVRAAQEPVH